VFEKLSDMHRFELGKSVGMIDEFMMIPPDNVEKIAALQCKVCAQTNAGGQ